MMEQHGEQNLVHATGLVVITNGEHAIHCGTHLERPERVVAIEQRLHHAGLFERCQHVSGRPATTSELIAVHSEAHIERMREVDRPLLLFDDSMYLNSSSFHCSAMAVGGTLDLVERVISGELSNGFALVRPPGHHVEDDDLAGGFGVFNNVAVAAFVARKGQGVDRVLIVDWDVHHGNGTQQIFENDPSVLYFSVHRYDNGDFFPCSHHAAPEVVGVGAAAGFNINVAWNIAWKDSDGMGDDDYLATWQHVLLPIVHEFKPDLVLISAGFDAAKGDIGGCSVTSDGFAQMTRMLQNVCSRVILVLEGGYRLDVISDCVCACIRSLLGDHVPMRTSARPKKQARLAIERTLRAHRRFWSSLRSPGVVDMMSDQIVSLMGSAHQHNTLECSDDESQHDNAGHKMHDLEIKISHDRVKIEGHRKKHRKPKPVTGVSVATRNAAMNNWKGDIKKLLRKQSELLSSIAKIEVLKPQIARRKMSAKERAILEEEDDIQWQLKEIAAELEQLDCLSQDDVLRMYSGCL